MSQRLTKPRWQIPAACGFLIKLASFPTGLKFPPTMASGGFNRRSGTESSSARLPITKVILHR